MKIHLAYRFLFLGIVCSSLFSCVEDEGNNGMDAKVDQTAFLENTAGQIHTSYQAFNESVNLLDVAIDSLTKNSNQQHLSEAKAALKTAYKNFQSVSHFEFGPADAAVLKSSINLYKTDTAQINSNISAGNYNLDQFAMKDAKGFPALDYLLNGRSNLETVTALSAKSNKCAYLKAVIEELKAKVNQVSDEWKSYRTTFAKQTGTDVGSSTGMLVNALNLHFEKFFRDNKIGIPLGVRSSGIARPDFVEAIYGGYSVELALDNLQAMSGLFNGWDGYGLDDYLIAVNAADLSKSIQDQLNTIQLKLEALSDPLPAQIASNPTQVQEAYTEMQKLIVLWKVDMPSRMGILITYQDNDGD